MPHWEEMWRDRELGTKFQESLDRRGNSLSGMWRTRSRLLSKPGRLDVFSIFLPNGERIATQWHSRLVPVLLTDCVLSCVFSDKLDTCDLLFDQLVNLFLK